MLENIKRKNLQTNKYDPKSTHLMDRYSTFKSHQDLVRWSRDIVWYNHYVSSLGKQRYATIHSQTKNPFVYTKLPEICNNEYQPNLHPQYVVNEKTDQSFWFNMIQCDAGSFIDRHTSLLDKTPKTIEIQKPFLLGETEVTQELYEFVMGASANKSKFKNNKQNPVENISLEKAVNFCNKLSELQGLTPCFFERPDPTNSKKNIWSWRGHANGYRLPTANEAQYAARSGTDNQWAGTNQLADLSKYAWFGESLEHGSTHTVRSKHPNEWGFYDMSGNVNELCWDSNNANYHRLWGGSFISDPKNLMFEGQLHNFYTPNTPKETVGFRIARTIHD